MVAAMSNPTFGKTRVCPVVGNTDLCLGVAVGDVLEALLVPLEAA